ncbi:MAG: DUF3047 domain-containing protein [Rhodoferax sp.]
MVLSSKHGLVLVAFAALAACSSVPADDAHLAASPWAVASSGPGYAGPPWHHYRFPGKQATQFAYSREDGRHAVLAQAVSSASMLRQTLRIAPADLGRVQFSWKVPQLVIQADLTRRQGDDSPARLILVFEGDRARFSARDTMMSELLRALTGEELPYATLMYVWSNQPGTGSVIVSPRTDRIRKLVVESGPDRLGRWVDHERDVRADFEQAFGEAPGALVGIGIMTDTDNTRSTARAWYGPVRFLPNDAAALPPVRATAFERFEP